MFKTKGYNKLKQNKDTANIINVYPFNVYKINKKNK